MAIQRHIWGITAHSTPRRAVNGDSAPHMGRYRALDPRPAVNGDSAPHMGHYRALDPRPAVNGDSAPYMGHYGALDPTPGGEWRFSAIKPTGPRARRPRATGCPKRRPRPNPPAGPRADDQITRISARSPLQLISGC